MYLVYLLTLLLMLVYLNQIWGILSFSEWGTDSMEVGLVSSDLLFMFLVLVVSSLVLFYSTYYMRDTLLVDYYLAVMFTFMVSVLLLVVSSSWVLLLLGWEGLGTTSFFLINFSGSLGGYGNTFVMPLTMRLGDYSLFFMLGGVLYGTYFNISLVSPLLCSFFLLFCMTKSAQFPFSGWLPKAMGAPTPTSTLVHSSTLVTAGMLLGLIYALTLSGGPLLHFCMDVYLSELGGKGSVPIILSRGPRKGSMLLGTAGVNKVHVSVRQYASYLKEEDRVNESWDPYKGSEGYRGLNMSYRNWALYWVYCTGRLGKWHYWYTHLEHPTPSEKALGREIASLMEEVMALEPLFDTVMFSPGILDVHLVMRGVYEVVEKVQALNEWMPEEKRLGSSFSSFSHHYLPSHRNSRRPCSSVHDLCSPASESPSSVTLSGKAGGGAKRRK